MPIRGMESTISQAIRSLQEQDYTNFRVTIVVDSPSDDAWDLVVQTIAEIGDSRFSVVPLTRRRPECSLVCNGLIQFLDQLGDDVELITFSGSDAVFPRDWMSRMVAEMSDPQVGCTLGNRWYMRPQAGLGWMIRYLWNVMGNVIAWQFRMPWGGTACLRVNDIHRSGLKDRWAQSMIEDIPIRDALEGSGLTMRFVPELIVIHRDPISLRHCLSFIKRQMFWSHIYAPNPMLLTVLFVGVILGTSILVLLVPVHLLLGNTVTAIHALLAVLLVIVLRVRMVCTMEKRIRAIMRNREEVTTPVGTSFMMYLPFALLLTDLAVAYFCIANRLRKTIDWRGVVYRVDGPFDVHLISDPHNSQHGHDRVVESGPSSIATSPAGDIREVQTTRITSIRH